MGAAMSGGDRTNGTFISYEAGTRKGEWVGKFVHANGDVMEGNVKKGALFGKGKYVFKNGDVYVGEFRQSKFEGKGKYMFMRSGDVYEGEWRYDQMHGRGKYTYKNGDVYMGMWKDGRADGQGTHVYANGDRYNGAWVGDKQTGRGTYEYHNGDLYVGELFEGRHDGSGSYKFAETGEYQVSVSAADADIGTGARWSRDTASAYKLVRGKPVVQISLQEARRIAAAVGEPIPEAPPEEQNAAATFMQTRIRARQARKEVDRLRATRAREAASAEADVRAPARLDLSPAAAGGAAPMASPPPQEVAQSWLSSGVANAEAADEQVTPSMADGSPAAPTEAAAESPAAGMGGGEELTPAAFPATPQNAPFPSVPTASTLGAPMAAEETKSVSLQL